MDLILKDALATLGFDESISNLPQMKDVRKKWLRLSLLLHPDKETGDKGKFQKLLNSFKLVCDRIAGKEYDLSDAEEDIARKMYEQFQFTSVKENLQTYTFLIDKTMIEIWENVLRSNYGEPDDHGNNGRKFMFNDSCENGGFLHITLYHTGKILLQAEKN